MKSQQLLTKLKRTSQSLFGFQNYLYLTSLVKYYFLRTNKAEQDIYKFITLIPDNSIILDIGSNIGVIATTLAKNKESCSVYCFEPIPANANNIRRLIRFFNLKNVSLKEMALGNEKGAVKMIVPTHDNVLYEGHSHILNEEHIKKEGLEFDVQIEKVDNVFAKEEQRNIRAIKIDVENHEFEVLKGAHQILCEMKPVVYAELWNNNIRFEVIDYLNTLGYNCFVNKNNNLVSSDGKDAEDLNFFFLHEAL